MLMNVNGPRARTERMVCNDDHDPQYTRMGLVKESLRSWPGANDVLLLNK